MKTCPIILKIILTDWSVSIILYSYGTPKGKRYMEKQLRFSKPFPMAAALKVNVRL